MNDIEKAIAYFKNCVVVTARGNDSNLTRKITIQALEEKLERENPQPLTLEELRQMIGEPIFIKRKYEAVGHWKILDSYGKCSTIEETFDFSDGEFEILKHYGKAWLAYRYPPKEATHAAENDS